MSHTLVTVKLLIMISAATFSLILDLFMIFISDAFVIFLGVMSLFLDLISPVIMRSLILPVVLSIRIEATMLEVVVFP